MTTDAQVEAACRVAHGVEGWRRISADTTGWPQRERTLVRRMLEAAEPKPQPIEKADRKGPVLAWAGEDGWVTVWPSEKPVVVAGQTVDWRDPSGALWLPGWFLPAPPPPEEDVADARALLATPGGDESRG